MGSENFPSYECTYIVDTFLSGRAVEDPECTESCQLWLSCCRTSPKDVGYVFHWTRQSIANIKTAGIALLLFGSERLPKNFMCLDFNPGAAEADGAQHHSRAEPAGT